MRTMVILAERTDLEQCAKHPRCDRGAGHPGWCRDSKGERLKPRKIADVSAVPCPDCGSTDVDRTPGPSKGDGEERISSSCAGCGANRGSSTRDMHGRVRNTPLVYPKGELSPHTANADDIQKVKDAINHCDAYGSVSMWLKPDGKITVVDWHGGESMTEKGFDRGDVRLHWDPNTFIVHFAPPLKPLQGVALFSLLEAIHMSSVTVMTPGGGVHVELSGNPSNQMRMVRNAMLAINDDISACVCTAALLLLGYEPTE